MLPTNCLKVEIYGLAYRARRAYCPMSDAVKTKTSPLTCSCEQKKQSLVKGTANIDKFLTKDIAGKEKMSIFAVPFGKQFFNGSIAQLV